MATGLEKMQQRNYVVLDVGKTLAKLSLWREDGVCLAQETRNNQILHNGSYQMLDVHGIDKWLAKILCQFANIGPICGIYPIAHGAAVAVIKDGKLAFDPIDYEWQFDGEIEAKYAELRGQFNETGSPRMENGLNMGLQLYYLKSQFAEHFGDGTQIMPWAQYWAWRLSGVSCTEISSLGAHTDLWSLQTNDYSKMAYETGIAKYFAPMRKAGEIVGTLSKEWCDKTNLCEEVKIYAGIHDSNAALYLTRNAMQNNANEFTIVSTGTWFVAMRATSAKIDMEKMANEAGVLFNIDIDGKKVPTALFMGGREIEILIESRNSRIDVSENQTKQLAATKQILDIGAFILPTATPGIGPFAGCQLQKINSPNCDDQYGALVAIYAALVTGHGLELIGANSTIIIEGRFSQSVVYCRAIASLMPDCKVYVCNEDANIALGVLKMMVKDVELTRELKPIEPLEIDLLAYRASFYEKVDNSLKQRS